MQQKDTGSLMAPLKVRAATRGCNQRLSDHIAKQKCGGFQQGRVSMGTDNQNLQLYGHIL